MHAFKVFSQFYLAHALFSYKLWTFTESTQEREEHKLRNSHGVHTVRNYEDKYCSKLYKHLQSLR